MEGGNRFSSVCRRHPSCSYKCCRWTLWLVAAVCSATLHLKPGFTGKIFGLRRRQSLRCKAGDYLGNRRMQNVRCRAEASQALSYQDAEYWERRYRTGDKGANQDNIDDRGIGWLCSYEGPVQETLHAITGGDRSKTLLNVGCGLDRFSQDLYADGFTNLLSSDISSSAISEMASKTADTMPLAKWFVDDALQMSIPSQLVDIVIDKGTLDALLIRSSPFTAAAHMLREVQRVLKVGGTYLLLTHGRGDPDTWRLPLLAMPHLSMNVAKTPDLGGYYIFVCTKLQEAEATDEAANWAKALAWASERDQQDVEAELDQIDEVGQ